MTGKKKNKRFVIEDKEEEVHWRRVGGMVVVHSGVIFAGGSWRK